MKTLAGTTEMYRTASYNDDDTFWCVMPTKVQLKRLLTGLWLFIKTVTEYAWGMYIGAFICLHLGWWAGDCYAEHVKPGYFSNFELSQASAYCAQIPFDFAEIGKIIGMVTGAIAIAITNSVLLQKGIISLYMKKNKDPKVIANALGTSERQVQRKIYRFIKKGKIRSSDVEI